MARRKHKISKIVSGVVVALLIVLVVGLVVSLTNGFEAKPLSFSVKYENATIRNNTTVVLPRKQNIRFDVAPLLPTAPVEFAVKVVPTVVDNNDFQFTLDGEIMRYGKIPDLTSAFQITSYTGYFTLTFPADIREMLQSVYPDSVITNLPDFSNDPRVYFQMQLLADGQKMAINFRGEIYVTGIEIDDGNVIF